MIETMASAMPSSWIIAGRSSNRTMENRIGTITPKRVYSEETITPWRWILYCRRINPATSSTPMSAPQAKLGASKSIAEQHNSANKLQTI